MSRGKRDKRGPPLPQACLALLLLLGVAPHPLSAQTDGSQLRSRIAGAVAKEAGYTRGRSVFVGIGINDYKHDVPPWKDLDNAVNDVRRLRAVLTEGYDFHSPDDLILIDGQATLQGIRELVKDRLPEQLEPSDQLVFFYAGHGHTETRVVGTDTVARTGYIVPVGASDNLSGYLEIEALLDDLNLLNVQHVLVILDSCYSGIALEGTIKMRGGEATDRFIGDLQSRRSRVVITSVMGDQLAADGGRDFSDNSLFTGWLIEGLERGVRESSGDVPDVDGDHYVTAQELFQFVQPRVAAAQETRANPQTPNSGPFGIDDSGQLVFVLEVDEFAEAYDQAVQLYKDWDQTGFQPVYERALALEPEGPRSAHLQLLSARMYQKGREQLLAALEALRTYHEAGVEIPIAFGELMSGLAQLQCEGKKCAP